MVEHQPARKLSCQAPFIDGSRMKEEFVPIRPESLMAIPGMLLVLLAAAAPPPSRVPIVVTGHAWAPFISPMGEPFRARSADDDTLTKWFSQADRDHDGFLTSREMLADADRFFAKLDTNHDGQIDPEELVQYEWEIAPDVQLMSRTKPAPGHSMLGASDRKGEHHHSDELNFGDEDAGPHPSGGLQGAARYGLLNMPEPVAAADTDFNRSITLAEFRQAAIARFQLLDSGKSGQLSLVQLQALRPAIATDRHRRSDHDVPDARIGSPLPPGN